MTEMSKSGRKQCPSEKVDCRILFPSRDGSISRVVVVVARPCGAIERLGGVASFGRTPRGLGEEGLGGTAIDSLVSELLFERDVFSADCIYRDLTIVPLDFTPFFPVPLLLVLLTLFPLFELLASAEAFFKPLGTVDVLLDAITFRSDPRLKYLRVQG